MANLVAVTALRDSRVDTVLRHVAFLTTVEAGTTRAATTGSCSLGAFELGMAIDCQFMCKKRKASRYSPWLVAVVAETTAAAAAAAHRLTRIGALTLAMTSDEVLAGTWEIREKYDLPRFTTVEAGIAVALGTFALRVARLSAAIAGPIIAAARGIARVCVEAGIGVPSAIESAADVYKGRNFVEVSELVAVIEGAVAVVGLSGELNRLLGVLCGTMLLGGLVRSPVRGPNDTVAELAKSLLRDLVPRSGIRIGHHARALHGARAAGHVRFLVESSLVVRISRCMLRKG